ncbi:hypothetical protein SHKM778_49190 [Streptomyces sp. KM77-8]|uniref:Uncharacterized protein n=1 Tax=Streptomyces haneummycinicus TaxID=3074435 RepID=A0AAT9HMH1_9ACTN
MARRRALGDVRRVPLPLVVREPVQYQVFLGGEVPEEGRLGDLGGRGDVVDRDAVEAVLQEQRDGRVADGVSRPFPLAGPQPRRFVHPTTVTFVTELLFNRVTFSWAA